MNNLANIDWDSVKAFIKGNTLLCALAILDLSLLFIAIKFGDTNESMQSQISSLQIKEKQIKANLEKLVGLEKHFEILKDINTVILKKCINFGKKTKIYNFLKEIDGFLAGNKLNIANTNLYDINRGQNINFNQDLSEFSGDSILANYNVSFVGKVEDLVSFLTQLNSLPYFTNLQKLEMRNNQRDDGVLLNVNLSFALLGKIQLKE